MLKTCSRWQHECSMNVQQCSGQSKLMTILLFTCALLRIWLDCILFVSGQPWTALKTILRQRIYQSTLEQNRCSESTHAKGPTSQFDLVDNLQLLFIFHDFENCQPATAATRQGRNIMNERGKLQMFHSFPVGFHISLGKALTLVSNSFNVIQRLSSSAVCCVFRPQNSIQILPEVSLTDKEQLAVAQQVCCGGRHPAMCDNLCTQFVGHQSNVQIAKQMVLDSHQI